METIIGIIFIIGYAAISLEHPLRINKTASAVLLAVVCWILYIMSGSTDHESVLHELSEHLAGIAGILFFLMAAMTIVELVDTHKGFRIITDLIQTDSKKKLLWIICGITFFLSAALDNMTTAIIMVSLLKKIVDDKKERMVMASMVIIAANAGGAWSPICDVTTTMLWIGGQISALNIVKVLFIPAVVSLLVPLMYQSFFMKGKFSKPKYDASMPQSEPYSRLIFFMGVGALIFVPVFKTITHLPPFMGMMFGLGLLWIVTEIIHTGKEDRRHLRVSHVLSKIDLSSILFFLGILLAVAALESMGLLIDFSGWLNTTIGNSDIIIAILGLMSSVIDNVPLVAATMGMYSLTDFPMDHKIWEMIAYCAGTGGSILIIGSAAGVVVMGMEKIEFFWYLKKIGFTALIGYVAGVIAYLGIFAIMN